MSTDNKIVRLFPLLHNIKPFLVKDHPEYHPATKDYEEYWEEHEKRCIEGLWGLDQDKETKEGGWRYCPPQLYYYVNFCVIEDEDESSNSSEVIIPRLRDIEWIFFTNWLICRGFSGFQNDKEYTSNALVYKLEQGIDLNPKDRKRLSIAKHIYKDDGSYKKYIHPREYLYKTHNKPLGLPLYENTALNLLWLASRGIGKSFIAAALISHTFKFHGATRFDATYFDLKKGPEIVVGAALSSKSADLLKKFKFMEEYQKDNFGAWGENDDFIPGFFFQNTLGTLVVNNNKSPYRAEFLYKEGGVEKVGGKGTKLIHVTYESNSEASVGTRPILSEIEEVGLATNLLQMWASNETTLIRRNKFGSQLGTGTGGSMEKIEEPKVIFEDPDSYTCLGFEDMWENRKKPIGLFIPAYYQDDSFRDINGNQDIEKAYEVEMYERAIRGKADNSFALDGYMMARPLVPSEMFLSGQSNIFPIAMLRDQLNKVEIKELYETYSFKGKLEWNKAKTGVSLIVDLQNKLKPILSINLDSYKNNLKGACVLYEAPEEKVPDPTQKRSLYKVVYDPYRDDGEGTSLASIIVYKGISENNWAEGLQDDIVAEYIGRMDKVDDVHEIAVQLAIYYNAKIMVETNIADFIRYCKREGRAHLLQAKPTDAIAAAVKNPGKKYDVGIDMTSPALQEQAEQLWRQWLLTEWKTLDNGIILYNLNKLKSPMILKQLIQYNRKGNFDHISSLKLLALWLSQEKRVPIQQSSEVAKETLNTYFTKMKLSKKMINTNSNYYNY
jgi:hypothetical protein